MDLAGAQDFLRQHHRGLLATLRRDGRPQLSPVLAVLDDAGRVVVSTRARSAKTHNLRRDPRVALCVFTDGFFGDWVQVEGRAEIVELPEAMDALVDYYRRASGEHPDWEDYRSAMRAEQRVVVRFEIERVSPGS